MFSSITSIPVWLLLLVASTAIGSAGLRYVDANSTSPALPYTTWSTAAHTIQDAVDAAALFDEIVVTNGVYATGGRTVGTNLLVNRVAVDKPLAVRSVNGPQFTVIQGYQVPGTTNGDGAIRCVYLADGASLSGFTLTNGGTRTNLDTGLDDCGGGGVWCDSTNAVVSLCILTSNSAADGGGVRYAPFGPSSILRNCIIYFNTAPHCANYNPGATINYSCTTPLPVPEGWQEPFVGNITNAPLFVDYAGGDLRLHPGSSCINAGLNAYAPGPTDLDGNPRIVTGTVDIGAYECQGQVR
ncbi:MAG: hypothetical protein JXQ71_11050 [Verrucomicrobia bacterium]|nr:hypothetical protein [Verrucomicrobiota bacterium]